MAEEYKDRQLIILKSGSINGAILTKYLLDTSRRLQTTKDEKDSHIAEERKKKEKEKERKQDRTQALGRELKMRREKVLHLGKHLH